MNDKNLDSGPSVCDTTIAEHVANGAHGSRYGIDWIWHDDRLGYLLTKPTKTLPPAGARDALAPLLSEAAALLWGCPDDDVADDCAKRLIRAAKALTGKAEATQPAETGAVEPCHCAKCGPPLSITSARMVLCATCGNKRCPHATDHRYACTGSNEPGQFGSAYGEPNTDAPGMGDAIAACPFCGKTDHDDWPIMEASGDNTQYIRCAWCHGSAPKSTWNRRAALAAQPAPVVGGVDAEEHLGFVEHCAGLLIRDGKPLTGRTLGESATTLRALLSARPGGEVSELRLAAKRNLRSMIERGSDDKKLMLTCLEELS